MRQPGGRSDGPAPTRLQLSSTRLRTAGRRQSGGLGETPGRRMEALRRVLGPAPNEWGLELCGRWGAERGEHERYLA